MRNRPEAGIFTVLVATPFTKFSRRTRPPSISKSTVRVKAVRGVPENELALPFTEPAPLPFHSLARRVAPLMLLRYRQLDRREIPSS